MLKKCHLGVIIGLFVVTAHSPGATIALEYQWGPDQAVENGTGWWYWTLVIHPSDIDTTIRSLAAIKPPKIGRDFKEYLRLQADEIGKHVRLACNKTTDTPGAGVALTGETHVLLLIRPLGRQGITVNPYEMRYHTDTDDAWRRILSEPKAPLVTALREAAAGLETILLDFIPVTKTGYTIAGKAVKEDGMLVFRDWGRTWFPKAFAISLDSVTVNQQLYFFKAPPAGVRSTAPSFLYHRCYGLLHLRWDPLWGQPANVIRCTWLSDSKNPKRIIGELLTQRQLKRIDEAHVYGEGPRGSRERNAGNAGQSPRNAK